MITAREEGLVVEILGKLDPKELPAKVFHAVERITALTAIETVFLRKREKQLKVLLLKRSDNDPYYPGMWHSPGSILRGGDDPERARITGNSFEILKLKGFLINYWKPFLRILDDELGVWFAQSPKFVGTALYHTLRGLEHAIVFLCECDREPKEGTWYRLDQLPGNLVAHHHELIRIAVDAFLENKV